MKKVTLAFAPLFSLFVVTGQAVADTQVGISPSGYKYFKAEQKEPSNGLFRLTDNQNRILLSISSTCGRNSSIDITRNYDPPKRIDNDYKTTFVSLTTYYDSSFGRNISNGFAVIHNIRTGQGFPIDFKLTEDATPKIEQLCSTTGMPVMPSAVEAERWLKRIDDGDIATDEAPAKVENGRPQTISDSSLLLTRPVKTEKNITEYSLIYRKDGDINKEQECMSFRHICDSNRSYVVIKRRLSGDQEFKRGFFATGLEIGASFQRDQIENFLYVVGSEDGVGMTRLELIPDSKSSLNARDFCNGTKPIILSRKQAVEWYNRINELAKRKGLIP